MSELFGRSRKQEDGRRFHAQGSLFGSGWMERVIAALDLVVYLHATNLEAVDVISPNRQLRRQVRDYIRHEQKLLIRNQPRERH